ncbi:uncharacterized protein K444DRAFT_623651 [Hyaloscypha bicolor E]|uniref:AMMECR1 domain-containing protein n=1 Tax=Hyaloscypha bicolor E TaxID=1095630 RepID=A0A2J6TWT7_9HELO|nr:uncharacterized protein K444DRAFT_623651 [Hyaloscypha bicolor E]PMD67492.1 hypothetical protein K444DRAFT_623651 [Hyaloscypha bicolor E]
MATVEHCLFCFEALSASLEKRTPMTLYQVQSSWTAYPKGLDEEDDDDEQPELESFDSSPPSDNESGKPSSSVPVPRNPILERLFNSSSGSSTPASSSSSSLSPSTNNTTPSSSSTSFVPIGLHPRRTSQRSSNITESPLFITWNTISPSSSKSLRGCIGTFEPQPLSSGLSSYALTSALSDHRFNPITLRELPTLEVSVTLLTDFENAKDPMDWELGVHGIRISFYARNKRYGACYLPDVAPEQGWDKEETIVSLMRKAGWGGKREKWSEVGDLKVVRFQGMAESAGWEEYKQWRDWVKNGEQKNN